MSKQVLKTKNDIIDFINELSVNQEANESSIGVETFLDESIKEYGYYVIETRALTNIMDGLRIGARKIIYSAFNSSIMKKKEKLTTLMGLTSINKYHHGNASLQNTCEFYSSPHLMKYCPFEIKGQIPSLRVSDVKTADRYLSIVATPNIELFTFDNNLWELKLDEGEQIEPKYFYPIVPMQLLQRTSSPGFGFSYKSFSYKLEDIIQNVLISLFEGNCDESFNKINLRPEIKGIKDENIIYNKSRECWYNVGECDLDFEKDVMTITDLPYNITYTKYEALLNKLEEKAIIKSWADTKDESVELRYKITFFKGRLKYFFENKWKFYQMFGLFTKINKPHLNVLDTNGKTILHFDNEYKLIDAFVKRRLLIYTKRKNSLLDLLEKEITVLKDKSKFIKLILDGKLVINNRPIEQIKQELKSFEVSEEGLKLRISKLTKEEYDEMINEIKDKEALYDKIKNTTEKEMYVDDLMYVWDKFIEPIENR